MRWVVPIVVCVAGCNLVFGIDPSSTDAPVADGGPPAAQWLAAAGADSHSCGIKADHTLWCWGRNDFGQLGIGNDEATIEVVSPAQVGSKTTWASVAAGGNQSCALEQDGALWCWGRSYATTQFTSVYTPTQIAGTWKSVGVGRYHACAIDDANALWCWGYNGNGQLGDATTTSPPAPIQVAAGTQWSAVAGSDSASCGLQIDGTLWCWGANDYGELGSPGTTPRAPAPVSTDTWKELAMGGNTSCGVRSDGSLLCWGDGRRGQLGDLTIAGHTTPTPVGQNQIRDWAHIAVGAVHACGLRTSGEMLCWGDNRRGQLGMELEQGVDFESRPTHIDGTWTSVVTGTNHTCAIDDAGHLRCAGERGTGALGDGVGSRVRPSRVGDFVQVSTGAASSCGLSAAGVVSCWGGSGGYGVFGDGTTTERQVPAPIDGAWTEVAVGSYVACAIDTSGQLQCWGRGDAGALGTGTLDNASKPQPVSGQVAIAHVAVGDAVCTTNANGLLACWGYNAYCEAGQPCTTGSPTTPYAASPALVGGAALWRRSAPGVYVTLLVGDDGTLATMGGTTYGLRGILPDPGTTESPLTVQLATPVTSITVGSYHACAVGDGQLGCWGANEHGPLGNRSTNGSGVPQVLPGTWTAVSAGNEHTCGIKTDGTLWCWGDNRHGQLGIGSFLHTVEPAQVGTDATWTSLDLGGDNSCGINSDGVYCWGANHDGGVGDGAAWRASYSVVGG